MTTIQKIKTNLLLPIILLNSCYNDINFTKELLKTNNTEKLEKENLDKEQFNKIKTRWTKIYTFFADKFKDDFKGKKINDFELEYRIKNRQFTIYSKNKEIDIIPYDTEFNNYIESDGFHFSLTKQFLKLFIAADSELVKLTLKPQELVYSILHFIRLYYWTHQDGFNRLDDVIEKIKDSKNAISIFNQEIDAQTCLLLKHFHNFKFDKNSSQSMQKLYDLITAYSQLNKVRVLNEETDKMIRSSNPKFKNPTSDKVFHFLSKLKRNKRNFSGITSEQEKESRQLLLYPYDTFFDKIIKFWGIEKETQYLLDYFGTAKKTPTEGSYYHSLFQYIKLSYSDKIPVSQYAKLPLCILSHEVGHHLQQYFTYFTLFIRKYRTPLDNLAAELEADYFAGFYLSHKNGLHLNDKDLEVIATYFSQSGDVIEKSPLEKRKPHGSSLQRKRAFQLGSAKAKNKDFKNHKVLKSKINELHYDFVATLEKTNFLLAMDEQNNINKYYFESRQFSDSGI